MKGRLPSWVPTIMALAVIALTVSLGNWQMRRAAEKRQLQEARDRAALAAPVALNAQRLAQPGSLIGHRVSAQGAFDEQHTVFVDNRSHRGQAGFHVLTPFVVEGTDQRVLVLRGWVAQDPAARSRLPAIASPASTVRIEALVQRDLDQVLELGRAPAPGPGDRLWQNASVEAMARWSGLSLAPMVLRQIGADEPLSSAQTLPESSSASAAVPVRDWVSPAAGVDKHRAYAFQWYSMAALVAALWSVLAWRSRRIRS